VEQIQTPHGIFTNNEFTKQSAQEVYNQWLADKDTPPLLTQEDFMLDLEFRVTVLELGIQNAIKGD